tara:strand:- start:311 stop:517 length:207 start_codon:yes stop_codon:yes gene_type:complete
VLGFLKALVMGIVPLFASGETNAPFFMEKFTLKNNDSSRKKYLNLLKTVSPKPSPIINAILISNVCIY